MENRSTGTCDKVANWINVEETKDRGKLGSAGISVPIKDIWVYPLYKKFRSLLKK